MTGQPLIWLNWKSPLGIGNFSDKISFIWRNEVQSGGHGNWQRRSDHSTILDHSYHASTHALLVLTRHLSWLFRQYMMIQVMDFSWYCWQPGHHVNKLLWLSNDTYEKQQCTSFSFPCLLCFLLARNSNWTLLKQYVCHMPAMYYTTATSTTVRLCTPHSYQPSSMEGIPLAVKRYFIQWRSRQRSWNVRLSIVVVRWTIIAEVDYSHFLSAGFETLMQVLLVHGW